jgi:DNA repair exonuclease SbcCD ATPase subunit
LRDEHSGAEKQGNGFFLNWIRTEFAMSKSTAYNFMAVAERFGEKLPTVGSFSPRALYSLASPSPINDEVLEMIEDGQIPPTLDAIREAKEALKRVSEAEAKARADAQAAQQRLFNLQESTQAEIEELTQQIDTLKQEMAELTTPEVEIREIEKEVIPQSVTMKLESLQEKVKTLTSDLETQKKTTPPSVQKKMEALQKQLDKLKEERKQQEEERKQQEERIKKLNEDVNTTIRKREFAENADRIRQGWRTINSEAHSCLMRLLGQWPTPVDVQTFEADDWARVEHLQSTLRRVLDECNNLRHSGEAMIIDERNTSPYALSLNGHFVDAEARDTN